MYKILIADDEQLMRDALAIMISKVPGFEVVYSVSNGEEAVELCKRSHVDIVFMDIMMPGISGIEASKRIYADNPETTIYILSSYKNFEFAIEALKAKVREYISKPVTCTAIKTLLQTHHQESKPQSQYLELAFNLLKNKDYKAMYYEVPKIVGEMFAAAEGSKEKLQGFAENLGQSLINYTERISGKSMKCAELFPMNDVVFTEPKSLEYWVFGVMNHMFRQISIKKYELLKNVFEYIDAHISEDIGLNEIIDNCAVSQGYLSRIFKSQMNVSVMEYLHMRKLMLAKEYFLFTDLSIAEVAFRLGYNESSYFSKVFKKYENVTVYQYKKNTVGTPGHHPANRVGDNYA